MFKILLASHGTLCCGMLDTIKIFTAETNHIQAIPFYTQEEGYDAEAALDQYMAAVLPSDQVVIFTDILWGSVNQKLLNLVQGKQNIHLITGLNLPIILEIITINPEEITPQLIQEKVTSCQESIVYMNNYTIDFAAEDE